ncbi:hypothetical protein SAMN06295905_2326 [Devosia lucknowensis]|uniref:Uncharacterized protein n=1 Tax=Devosia lucknowensis TaxID=1096929 RepID=A0A1Y6FJ41_9HYPH|nr:hypothetical protein [Devosia lucknowensis]SMQ74717.1 hypothetical protein SAMN06295905_2326 [Devosia lucknowensis]
MDEMRSLRQTLRPIWVPSLALVSLLVASGLGFSGADRNAAPPSPDTLIVERVRIDRVQHTREPAGPSGPSLRTGVALPLAQSDDWPGITFRFSGAAAGVSIIPPVVFDLYLTSSLAEQAERRRQWPNVFPQLQVHGVAQDGKLLVDPQAAYDLSAHQKRQGALFGYGFLALAVVPAVFLVRRARKVFALLMN